MSELFISIINNEWTLMIGPEDSDVGSIGGNDVCVLLSLYKM